MEITKTQNTAMNDWQKRDYEEKLTAFKNLMMQYPEIERLRDLDPQTFRINYASIVAQAVSRELDIPISGIDILGGKPYINKTGLTAKIQKDPREVQAIKAIPVLFPMKLNLLNTPGDADFSKYFVGYSGDETAVYHGIVRFKDGSFFEDEGTANAKFLVKEYGKMKTMQAYIMELAATRATNRAMRLATGIGLVSSEELNTRGITSSKDNMAEFTDEKTELILEAEKLFTAKGITEAARIDLCMVGWVTAKLEEFTEDHLKTLIQELKA